MTSLPRPALRNALPGMDERFLAFDRRAVGRVPDELEGRDGRVVDLAEVVVDARHLEPARVGRHHPPRQEVVERRAPQHGLLAARVHRDVAADARGVGGRRVDGEDESRRFGRVHHAARDDAGAAIDRRDRLRVSRESRRARSGESRSSFSVLITAERRVSGIAPPV